MCRHTLTTFDRRKVVNLENEELVGLIQQGKNVSENLGILYEQNEGLIWKICLPLSKYCEMEDLMQEAFLGIVDAVKQYDSSMENKFVTYFPYKVRQHCVRYIENTGNIIRIPVNLQKTIFNYRKLIAKHGGVVDEETVRKELNLSSKQYNQMIEIVYRGECSSLDSPIQNQEEGDDVCCVVDTLHSDADVESEAMDKVLSETLWNAVDRLDDRKRDIIIKRYKGEEPQSQVAKEYGVSIQNISQHERRALKQLHQMQDVLEMIEECNYGNSDVFHGGLQSFMNSNSSVVERIVLKKDILVKRYRKQEAKLEDTMYFLSGVSSDTLFGRIDQLCKMKGITKKQLEQEAGLGAGVISKWKTGFNPRKKNLKKVADVLGVSVEYLQGKVKM